MPLSGQFYKYIRKNIARIKNKHENKIVDFLLDLLKYCPLKMLLTIDV